MLGARITGSKQTSAAGVLGITEIQWCILHILAGGSTTAGLQEAHDALPATGGWIILANGRYDITDEVNIIKPNVKIIGHQNSHINGEIIGGDTNILHLSNTGCEMRDFRVTCDIDNVVVETTTDSIFCEDGHNLIMDNVQDDYGPAAGHALNITTANQPMVRDCGLDECRGDAIVLLGTQGASIIGNLIINSGGMGIEMGLAAGPVSPLDSLIYSNTIIGPISHGIYANTATRAQIMGNHITDGVTAATFGIQMITSNMAAVIGNTIDNWDAAANMYGVAIEACQMCNINDNIINATSGYGIVIYGAQPTNDIVANNVIYAPGSSGILVQNGVRVSVLGNNICWGQTATTYGIHMQETNDSHACNNIIENWDAGINMGGILWTDGVRGLINNNSILTCSGHGIWLDDAAGVDPDYCSVSGNIVYVPGGDGIRCEDSDYAQIAQNLVFGGTGVAAIAIDIITSWQFNVIGNIIHDWDADVGQVAIYTITSYMFFMTGNIIRNIASHAFHIVTSDTHVISGNVIYIAAGHGMFFNDCDNHIVNGNYMVNSLDRGIYKVNGVGFIISNNTIGSNTNGCIELNTSARTGFIQGNRFVSSTVRAVTINGAYEIGVFYNHFDGCTEGVYAITGGAQDPDAVRVIGNWFEDPSGSGIHIENGDRCQVCNNSIFDGQTAATNGIYMSNCDYGMVLGNVIDNWDAAATMNGIYWTDGQYGIIESNLVNTTSGQGIVLENDGGTGPVYMSVSKNKVISPGSHGIHVSAGSYGVISGNSIYNGPNAAVHAIFADAVSWVLVICGNLVYDWNQNAGCVGIITDNCRYACITGNIIYQTGSTGISNNSGHYSSIVGNQVVSSNGIGIYSNTASEIVICGNRIDDPGTIGISLVGACASLLVSNNIIVRATIGISSTRPYTVIINNNLIQTCSSYGIYAYTTTTDPDDYLISGNIVDAVSGDGIRVENGDRLQVIGNKILNGVTATTHGIRLTTCNYFTADGNTIDNWDAAAGMVGIYASDCRKGIISSNMISFVSSYGIFADDAIAGTDPDDATVIGNTILSPGIDGITIEEGDRAQVIGNRILDGPASLGVQAINLLDCDYAKISSNIIENWDAAGSCDGILWQDGIHGTISDNTISNVSSRGIALIVGSSHMVISGNVIHVCTSDGIYAIASHYLTVIGNDVHDGRSNGTYGVRVEDSNWAKVNNNTIAEWDNDGTCDGISIHDCTFFQVNSNVIDDVGRDGIRVESTGAGSSIDGLINGNTVSNAVGDGVFLVDNVQQTDVVNNHCRGLGITMGAGAGNQNDWGSGHNLNRV